ncbi:Protein argonaute 4 [Glycine soja]
MEVSKRVPMARKEVGSKGEPRQLLANHFGVCLVKPKDDIDGYFYHYDVAMSYEDGNPVEAKGVGRKVLNQVCETYVELRNMSFAYDGEKSLFTLGPLASQRLQYPVVLEDVSSRRVGKNGNPAESPKGGYTKRMRIRHQFRPKTINVDIKYAAKIPLQAIEDALRGRDSEKSQEALRVLDIILRQHSANQGCLLVRQSFFHDNRRTCTDIGGGVQGCCGFHSSFRVTQGGLSLNMDVTTTMIVKPGPVVDFLLQNQSVQNPNYIDWTKAKRMLKNLRIRANGVEFKISGLSDNTCRNQKFLLRQKGTNGEVQEREITVHDYFTRQKLIGLNYSADMPCINVGKPKRPSYFPIELCEMVSLQRYTKALTNLQRAQLVEKTRQKPQVRRQALEDALRSSRYDDEPMLRSSGITIEPNFVRLVGRVLEPPKLIVGGEKSIIPRNGRWNFNNKKLYEPLMIGRWAIVNFSSRCDTRLLIELIRRCAAAKGMAMSNSLFDKVIEEDGCFIREPPNVRVERMYAKLRTTLPHEKPHFLLCILPEKKNSDIYGPWKKKSLVEEGIVTQCIAPTKINDQYITNVLLKINAKYGGMNSYLSVELCNSIPFVSAVPTLILGMDVSHGSPGRSDVPSIAAVVSSRCWPQISRYRASVRTQSSKVEMIQSLFKPVANTNKDEGIIREVLLDFEITSFKRKPQQIIIFRDGVSESQFNQVLNIELSQIIEACKHLDEKWDPKFTLIIAQKNHHTRFFQANARDQTNVPPGTVIDNTVCHPKNNDFYLCAQAGMILCHFGQPLSPFGHGGIHRRDPPGTPLRHRRGPGPLRRHLGGREPGVPWFPLLSPPTSNIEMCISHIGWWRGTTRPTHYHVLHDEIGFSADEVQELVHSLSYTYQRSTTAVSLVAPICYAHLAAAQMAQFMKFDEHSETSSTHGGLTSASAPLVPQLPRLHKQVINSMFFC